MTENFSSPQELSSIRDFIRWAASRFSSAKLSFGHGTDNALDEARWLVLFALNLPWNLPNEYLACTLATEERLYVAHLIERRIRERKPAAYLCGQAMFCGLNFFVDERVLVPRSPIAELIEESFEPWLDASEVTRVLDLGTGSGCIAIACATVFPNAVVDAVDVSARALEVAAINVEKHDLKDRVRLIESDLFERIPEDGQYDLIVSNPPYVAREEWERLPAEYHAEPKQGLLGGESGLDFVDKILTGAVNRLSENGILVVEVGSSADNLLARHPDLPLVWPDFERGGDGVFLLGADQLHELKLRRRI